MLKKKTGRKSKPLFMLIWALIGLTLIGCLSAITINTKMVTVGKSLIVGGFEDSSTTLPSETLQALDSFKGDCILILGAGLLPDGSPNLMLRDRLEAGIALYKEGFAPKLLLSGDNGQERYDEVNAMKKYVLEQGVPLEDIFMDHAGFSTYDSMYRADAIFDVKKAIVVTQKYHLYRSLYLAEGFGISPLGVYADQKSYFGQQKRDLREFLARNKDFIKMIIKPKPKFLGDIIPISGNGILSHD